MASNLINSNLNNCQAVIESYETLIREITEELNLFKLEQESNKSTISNLIKENEQLSSKLKDLTEKLNNNINFQFKETEFINNLKEQLTLITGEKEYALNLWRDAVETIDNLEDELKLYQGKNDEYGLVPKNKLLDLKKYYDEKIKNFEQLLAQTQSKLTESIEFKTNELELKNLQINETRSSQDNAFKIIQNLESEILKLQNRLQQALDVKSELEQMISNKNEDVDKWKRKSVECSRKVEEAVQVVEAALNEKDAALLRENNAKEEISRLSATLSDLIDETNIKVRNEVEAVKNEYRLILEKVQNDLKLATEKETTKCLEIEKYAKECILMNKEIERLQKNHLYVDESGTSKLLLLEKNLENTFQKLLLSEKQNIRITAEKDSIKNDLNQMAGFYERDIKARETETLLLKSKLKQNQIEFAENISKLTKSTENIDMLNNRIESMEIEFKQEIEKNKHYLEDVHKKKLEDCQRINEETMKNLEEQLELQRGLNQKWRNETIEITEKLANRIRELKKELSKVKLKNRIVTDKLKDSSSTVQEYKQFLQTISNSTNSKINFVLPHVLIDSKSVK